jgi:excisionase family DNA binding protein
MSDFLTKADAAKLLGITPAAVALLERKGHLSAVRTAGGGRLFQRAAVERLAAERAEQRRRPADASARSASLGPWQEQANAAGIPSQRAE